MINSSEKDFATLFKKYRFRSEIETLAEFGDLLAEEGFIYETSLFTRWQKGDRVPKERKVLLAMLRVFVKRKGITTIVEANQVLNSVHQENLTRVELASVSSLLETINVSVLQTSLGGLIKDYRTQKGISKQEIVLAMGWIDISYIDNLEAGQTEKPSREVLSQLCKIMELKEIEQNQLLFAGHYLPTEEDIIKIRASTHGVLDMWKFPTVLLDFSWRYISENRNSKILFNHSDDDIVKLQKETPTVLELQFEPNYILLNRLSTAELELFKDELVQMLIQYRYAQFNRRNEEWYQSLIHKMQKNELFRETWKKSLQEKMQKITNIGKKTFLSPYEKDKRLNFEFIAVPLIEDPRFIVEYFFPSDEYTHKFFLNRL